MSEKIIPKDKRFVTIERYKEISGLSYATIDHMLKSGQLNYILTESGKRRIDIKDFTNENAVVIEKLEKTERMLSAICKQFNIVI